MISNLIAHLQGSAYPGEKFRRPQRQAVESQQHRLEALRAAQLVNIRKQHQAAAGQPPA